MGNVTLPTPVFLAGGVLCLLAGYLIGVVAGPETPSRTVATVTSYDRQDGRLCLRGDAVKGQPGAGSDDRVCGIWRRAGVKAQPVEGDRFRFVIVPADNKRAKVTVIYGDVVS